MRHDITAVLLLALVTAAAAANVVDDASTPVPPLDGLADALGAAGIDVLYSHDSEAGRVGPSFGDRPRVAPLIGFKTGSPAELDLERYSDWLDAFEQGARGAVAAAPTEQADKRPALDVFTRIWDETDERDRVVVTFDAADLTVAERVAGVLERQGYAVYLAIASPDRETLHPELLGALFVHARHVLVIDTATARMNDVIQFEADLLAELRMLDEWVDADEVGLAPVRRGSLDVVEALGVLPARAMPGGIVLGRRPVLPEDLAHATFGFNGSDYGIMVDDRLLVIEQVSAETREAISGLVGIEDSHVVVDIAGGEVTLAAPLEGTRVGSRMAAADRRPFEHLSVRGAVKSLIVDDAVVVRRDGDGVEVDVTLEVRFYRRDDQGHAVRLSAVAFTVQDACGGKRLRDVTWSRKADAPRIGFDGCGIDGMLEHLEQCALDAALISLARLPQAGSSASGG